MERDMEGSDCGFIEVLSQRLPRGTEENHEVTKPRFEATIPKCKSRALSPHQ
jgi:hypothetical protein